MAAPEAPKVKYPLISFKRSELGHELYARMRKMPRAELINKIKEAFQTQSFKEPEPIPLPAELVSDMFPPPIRKFEPLDSEPSDPKPLELQIPKFEPTRPVQHTLPKIINIKNAGDLGERFIRDVLATQYEVMDASRTSFSGDIHIRRPRKYGPSPISIMVEVKNYSHTVPLDEDEKFRRDLAVLPSVQGAAFICLNSSLPKRMHIELTTFDAGREMPIIYINSDQPEIILSGISLLHAHIDQKEMIREHLATFQKDDHPKIWRDATRALELLNGIAKSRVYLTDMRTTLCSHIDRIQATIIVNEGQIREILDRIQTRVAKLLPDALTGGVQVSGLEAWTRVMEIVCREFPHMCLGNNHSNAMAVSERLISYGTFKTDKVMIRRAKNVIAMNAIRLKLFASKTDISRPAKTAENGSIIIDPMTIYDGTYMIVSIGKKGELLNPKDKSIMEDATVTRISTGAEFTEDMLGDLDL